MTSKLDQLSPELRALLANIKPRQPGPRPKPPLTLAASGGAKPEEAVASVALEGDDLERVRGALSGRYAHIDGDEVDFNKVTHARVTMRWCRPTPANEAPHVVSAYNPFSFDRLPGDEGDE
jgi:hypothetical protein